MLIELKMNFLEVNLFLEKVISEIGKKTLCKKLDPVFNKYEN